MRHLAELVKSFFYANDWKYQLYLDDSVITIFCEMFLLENTFSGAELEIGGSYYSASRGHQSENMRNGKLFKRKECVRSKTRLTQRL